MESIRRLHEEILKREYKAEKQRKEEMRYDQMDCLLLAGEEKTERTIPVCETVFPEKFADLNAVREVLLTPEKQVYALIAPAFMGQFGEGVSPGGQGGEKDASGCCHRVYRSVPCQEKGGEGAGYLRCD